MSNRPCSYDETFHNSHNSIFRLHTCFAQDFTARIEDGERLMELAEYTAAKQQFELALSDANGDHNENLALLDSEGNERLQNDLLEARIMTGDFDKALESFNETIVFTNYREGIRRYHLERLLYRHDKWGIMPLNQVLKLISSE